LILKKKKTSLLVFIAFFRYDDVLHSVFSQDNSVILTEIQA